MVRPGEIEHGQVIAEKAETVWNWASPAGRQRAVRRAQLIIKAAHLTSDMRVLEIGCGTGLFTREFAAVGCDVDAIDVSPDLLAHTESKHIPGSVTFRIDDAEALSYEDETFDAVVGSSILHHLDVPTALAQMYRVLKPGGRMAFAEPNMMNPQIAMQRKIPILRRLAGESPEETAFVRWKLMEKIVDTSFDSVSIEPFDFLHPFTPRPLIGLVKIFGATAERLPLMREIAGSLLICARKPISVRQVVDEAICDLIVSR